MSSDLSDLPERIRALTDEELLRMVHIESADYRPETLEIALQEIGRRGLPATASSTPEPAPTREPASWNCSKCGESIDGAFQSCWNCGTSIDGVEDLRFVAARTSDTASEPPPAAWTCRKCGENVEGALQVCWKCGTSIEGVEDPYFPPREAPPSDAVSDLDGGSTAETPVTGETFHQGAHPVIGPRKDG